MSFDPSPPTRERISYSSHMGMGTYVAHYSPTAALVEAFSSARSFLSKTFGSRKPVLARTDSTSIAVKPLKVESPPLVITIDPTFLSIRIKEGSPILVIDDEVERVPPSPTGLWNGLSLLFAPMFLQSIAWSIAWVAFESFRDYVKNNRMLLRAYLRAWTHFNPVHRPTTAVFASDQASDVRHVTSLLLFCSALRSLRNIGGAMSKASGFFANTTVRA